MSLFEQELPLTLLEKDGLARYFGKIFTEVESARLFQLFVNEVQWEQDEAHLFGKKFVLNRKMALYSKKARSYTYSGSRKVAHNWTPFLVEMESVLKQYIPYSFNTCLFNFYPSGSDKMGYHADDEKEIVTHSTIASLSFGPTRFFDFKHQNSGEKKRIALENGSLLTMENQIQHFWKHQLPEMKKIKEPRINLTFRNLY